MIPSRTLLNAWSSSPRILASLVWCFAKLVPLWSERIGKQCEASTLKFSRRSSARAIETCSLAMPCQRMANASSMAGVIQRAESYSIWTRPQRPWRANKQTIKQTNNQTNKHTNNQHTNIQTINRQGLDNEMFGQKPSLRIDCIDYMINAHLRSKYYENRDRIM